MKLEPSLVLLMTQSLPLQEIVHEGAVETCLNQPSQQRHPDYRNGGDESVDPAHEVEKAIATQSQDILGRDVLDVLLVEEHP